MSNSANAALAEPWKDLWNGNLRANADSLLFFQQLGIQAVPALG
jgi:hypothetical protein